MRYLFYRMFFCRAFILGKEAGVFLTSAGDMCILRRGRWRKSRIFAHMNVKIEPSWAQRLQGEFDAPYFSQLTDTLRKYIEERYGFMAMEMTSSEIIDRLTETQDQQALDELRMLFQTADLVKFAKYSTLINENDMNLVNAIEFINKTKMEAQPDQKAEKPQMSEEEVRSKKTRRVLKGSITALIVSAAAILVYVIYVVYTLFI